MSWFRGDRKGVKVKSRAERREIPDNLWVKCQSCGEILYRQELEKNLWVCSACRFHFRIGARDYLGFLLDEDSFEERHVGLTSLDPLKFKAGRVSYPDQIKRAQSKSNLEDAVVTGFGRVEGEAISIAVMDFDFMGGSMGSVVGEKIARAIQDSIETRRPLIIICRSGGARMQESILSLMQMAKTSAMLGRLRQAQVPFISVLTHPTTGGVTASFAMLGDLILVEPKALVGFAGPRVIRDTIQSDLPEGFQTAEFLLEHGMVDKVVERKDLRGVLKQVIRFFIGDSSVLSGSEDDAETQGDGPLPLFDGRVQKSGPQTNDAGPRDGDDVQTDVRA